MNNIKKIFKESNFNKIKETIKNNLFEKLFNKLYYVKKDIAEELIIEKDKNDDVDSSNKIIKITKIQTKAGHYKFLFSFGSKIIVVNFDPLDVSNTKYKVSINAQGQDESDKFLVRSGISNINLIPALFSNVFHALEQFLILKKPVLLRFVAGKNMVFPSIFHSYIYPVLKDFSQSPIIKKNYTIIRGDATKDGSAFVLKRGATQSNLKSRTWKPVISPTEEQIANVTGPAVATDRPIKPPLGLPGLAMARRDKRYND